MKGNTIMLNFLISSWNEILIAISSIISGASAISAMTPTQKDDNILSKIKKVVDLLALNIGNAKPIRA